jgi:hypothetical protein
MVIKIVRRGQTQIINDATLVIVEDDYGNPVSLAAKSGIGNGFTVACIDDEARFNQTLRNLGIDKVVIKAPLDPLLLKPAQLPTISPR